MVKGVMPSLAAVIYMISALAVGASGILVGGVWAELSAYALFMFSLPSSLVVGAVINLIDPPVSSGMEWVVLLLLVIVGYFQWFKLVPWLERTASDRKRSAGPRSRRFIALFDPLLSGFKKTRNESKDTQLDP